MADVAKDPDFEPAKVDDDFEPHYDSGTKKFLKVAAASGRTIGTPTEKPRTWGDTAKSVQQQAEGGLAFMVGEEAGGAAGALTGIPGAEPVGAAVGAGVVVTLKDMAEAYDKHKKDGTPLDMSKNTALWDLVINAGTSAVMSVLGKGAQSGIPAETRAIHGAVEKGQLAKQQFEEKVTAQGQETMEDLAAQQKKDLAAAAKTDKAAAASEADRKKFETKMAQKGQRAMESLAAKQQSQLGKVSPQAQVESIQRTTGRTPETAAAAQVPPMVTYHPGLTGLPSEVSIPSSMTLAKQGGLKGTYFAVKNKIGDMLGNQYEDLLKKYGDNKSSTAPISETLDKWEGIYAQEGRDVPTPLKKLLEDARDISPRSFLDKPELKARGKLDPLVKKELQRVSESGGMLHGVMEPGAAPTSTVNRILALKRAAQKFMVGTNDDRSSQIAEEIADSANRSLGNAGGLPEDVRRNLANLNTQYADHKRMFPRSDIRTMATAQTPIEGAEHIFNNPTLADRVIANSTPEQKKILQEGFGDWAQLHPNDLLAKGAGPGEMRADAVTKARIYGRLFPGSPLADPNALVYVGATLQNIEQAPAMKALFDRSMEQAQQQAIAKGAPIIQAEALRLARDIGGPSGDALKRQIDSAMQQRQTQAIAQGAQGVRQAGLQSAKTMGGQPGAELTQQINTASVQGGAKAAADVAFKFFTGLTPEQSVQQITQMQGQFGSSVAKDIAPSYTGSNQGRIWFQRLLQNPASWPVLAAFAGVKMMAGGSAGFYGTLAAMGSVGYARMLVTNAFVKGLADPEIAKALLAGTKGARIGIMHPLATTLFQAGADQFASQLAKHFTGKGQMSPESKPEEEDDATAARSR